MTVYEAYDQPSGRSHPIMEIVSGGRRLEVVDTTPDGGMGFSISPSACGRPVKPESVPTAMTFPGNRKTQDLEAMFVYTVSERLKDLIEEIEPDTHQFLPVTIVKRNPANFSSLAGFGKYATVSIAFWMVSQDGSCKMEFGKDPPALARYLILQKSVKSIFGEISILFAKL
ncbi:hypothetical protein QP162_22760 [Sphingomonas aurantiaca]|uniref:imm11 family protein n=1 Tax=Sphingomonas aurantiaca TaxID=185949 RepID=UPI002FE2A86F